MQHINQRKEFLNLIEKYLKGEATPGELDFIQRYYESFAREEDVLNTLSASERNLIEKKIETSIMGSVGLSNPSPVRRLWSSLSLAATVLIALSVGLYFYYSDNHLRQSQENVPLPVDIAPGSNKATLTLADGSQVSLDDVKNGQIAEQSGSKITKTEDGQIIYDVSAPPDSRTEGKKDLLAFNTVTTPLGGQYQIILPDGTKVWLNAGSSLKYPTVFNGKERKVELSGEGYFEVAKNKNMPFKVETINQETEVIGTIFNINSYADEPSIKTTLVEGSVRVKSVYKEKVTPREGKEMSVILKPGEQSALWEGGMSVSKVDTEVVIAWKRGIFKFHNSDIGSVMRQLSKWYDVKVEFEGKMPDIRLWGEMDRNVNASEALEMLAYFNLKYRVVQTENAKKIIIY